MTWKHILHSPVALVLRCIQLRSVLTIVWCVCVICTKHFCFHSPLNNKAYCISDTCQTLIYAPSPFFSGRGEGWGLIWSTGNETPPARHNAKARCHGNRVNSWAASRAFRRRNKIGKASTAPAYSRAYIVWTVPAVGIPAVGIERQETETAIKQVLSVIPRPHSSGGRLFFFEPSFISLPTSN